MEIEILKGASLKSLKQQRDQFAACVSKLDEAIRILEGNPEKPIDWKNTALRCLKHQDKFMTTVGILECMFYNEKEKLADDRKRKNYINALSLALNNLCENEKLGRLTYTGKKGYLYGLIDWYEQDNTIKEIYSRKIDEDLDIF